MTRVGLIFNAQKEAARKAASQVRDWLIERGVDIAVLSGVEEVEPLEPPPPDLVKADFYVIFGGDGTLLRMARKLAPLSIPLLSVNMGTLGFLSELNPNQLFNALPLILDGKYTLDRRGMLVANVIRDGQQIAQFHALNDLVIAKGVLARVIEIPTYIDNEFVTAYIADGLIVSTPTGSTAYSLNAGGPIITPAVEAHVIAPICPSYLTARPIVVSAQSVITLETGAHYDQEVNLTIDGQVGFPLQHNDVLKIGRSPYQTPLVRVRESELFSILRNKLHWGQNPSVLQRTTGQLRP